MTSSAKKTSQSKSRSSRSSKPKVSAKQVVTAAAAAGIFGGGVYVGQEVANHSQDELANQIIESVNRSCQ